MVISRTMSYAAVIAAIVSVGSDCFASEVAAKMIDNNKVTLGAMALGTALPEDADAAKAALETAGVALDQALIKGADKVNLNVVPVNFVANVAARKIGRCLAANGYSLPNPDLGTAGNHVVKPLRDVAIAAAPQLIAGLAVMACCK